MMYSDFLSIHLNTNGSPQSGASDQASTDTPRGLTRDIGTFRTENAKRFCSIKEVRDVLDSLQSICIIPEPIAQKYSIISGDFYIISTSEQFVQNKTRGSEIEFVGEREFLLRVITCPSEEWIDRKGDIIILPDLVFHSLSIIQDSSIILKRLEEAVNDITLEIWRPKKDSPIRVAKRLLCKVLVNKYQKYVTPELIHTLLKERNQKILNRYETLVVNFCDKINGDFLPKSNKPQKTKSLRLNAEKITTPAENFVFVIKIKDIDSELDVKLPSNITDLPYLPHSYLFDAGQTSISLENPPYNTFFPIKKMPISTYFSSEFLETAFEDSYLSRNIDMLSNIFRESIQNRSPFSHSKFLIALSHPSGIGLSLLLKNLAIRFGFNFLEKNMYECYSLQEVEKAIAKGIYMRPSVVLLKRFTHLQAFLDQKASISYSNSLSSYIEHLSEFIAENSRQYLDNLPCLIILAENQYEKVESLSAEASEVLKGVYHMNPATESEHLGVIKTLLKWFDVTLDDIDELGTLTKGVKLEEDL